MTAWVRFSVLRPAADAAIELRRSGVSSRDAVDTIRARFGLTDAEADQVVARVDMAIRSKAEDDAERHADYLVMCVLRGAVPAVKA